MKVGDLFAVLHLDKKGFTTGLTVAKGEAGGFGKVFGKVALGASAAIAVVGAAAINMAADFQKSMANVQTLIGKGTASDARIKELGQSVKDMSMETGKSLDDLTGGLYEVIGTFGDTADTVALLDVAARAGAAGMSTTQEAVKLLAALTKSYGDTSAEAAQHSADLAFQTANLGVTTFPEMAQSMGRVIPTAAALKISQEELFAVMATLTGVTGSTDQVTTQLRGSMTAMLKPSREMSKALEELGYTGVNAGADIVSEHGLVGAMQMLYDTNTRTNLGVSKLWRNTNTLNAVLALTGGQADTFADKMKAMSDVTGVTNQAFEIQQQTVTAMQERIGASFEVMMVNLGEKLLPLVQSVLTWILNNWPAIAGTFDAVASAVGTSISIVATVIGKLIDIIAFLKPVLIGVGIIISAVLVPVLAVLAASAVASGIAMAAAFALPAVTILALAAAVAATAGIINHFAMDFGDMGDRIHQIADDTKNDFTEVKDWIRARMDETGESFEEAAAAAETHFGAMSATASEESIKAGEALEGYEDKWKNLPKTTKAVADSTKVDTEDMGQSLEDFADEAGIDLSTLSEEELADLEVAFGDMAATTEEKTDDAAEAVESFVRRTVKAIQDAEDPVRDAGDAAADAWLDPIKTATEIAALEAELGSKELAENLRSEDANIVRDAQMRTNEITAELIRLKNEQATQGDAAAQAAKTKSLLTSQFMRDGLASKDEEIKNIFRTWKDELEARVAEMEGAARRSNIGGSIRDAINRDADGAVGAMSALAARIRGVMPGSEPKDPSSPFRGITRGWGIGDVLEKGFASSLKSHDFAGLFAGAMTPVAAQAGGGGSIATRGMGAGDRAAAGSTYNIYGVQPGDVMREVMRAERRLATEWETR